MISDLYWKEISKPKPLIRVKSISGLPEKANKRKEGKIMKRTKSMVYKPTVESRELVLVATNDGDLYRQVVIPCIKNLNRKYKKGLYDPDKAVDLWYNLANKASEQYKKSFGYGFTVTERFTAAVEIEEHYRESVENGWF